MVLPVFSEPRRALALAPSSVWMSFVPSSVRLLKLLLVLLAFLKTFGLWPFHHEIPVAELLP